MSGLCELSYVIVLHSTTLKPPPRAVGSTHLHLKSYGTYILNPMACCSSCCAVFNSLSDDQTSLSSDAEAASEAESEGSEEGDSAPSRGSDSEVNSGDDASDADQPAVAGIFIVPKQQAFAEGLQCFAHDK